jgi:hypothetical protein
MSLVRQFHPLRIATLASAVALLVLVSTAGAFDLRTSQVPFCTGSLRSYLNSVGENAINLGTDQVNGSIWSSTVSGNSEFTLMIELAGYADQNALGVYNADDAVPALFEVFPGRANAGWNATVHFLANGDLLVDLYDDAYSFQGRTTYHGVHRNRFGFYLAGPGGTFYSQDGRNAGGNAQVLTYAGTGINSGSWWQCFEDLPYQYPDCLTDFEDAVMFVESLNPVPAHGMTWGAVKGMYSR